MSAGRAAAVLLALLLTAAAPGPRIGLEMPAAGDDGGAGLAVAAAVRLALGPAGVVARDSAGGGVLNPHQDEGSDNDTDRRLGPAIVAGFAADPRIAAALGGLRRSVGDADAAAAGAHGLPTVLLARWSSAGGTDAFCLCSSPPRLVAFARAAARRHFGPRLLVVLAGPAAALPGLWPGRFGAPAVAVGDDPAAIAAARRRAGGADAVLLLADERPATLWRATAFARRFDQGYLRGLGRRGAELLPAGTRGGEVLVVAPLLPDGPRRRAFAARFHAAAGYQPDEAATRGYAAAETLRAAGADRAAVRAALRRRRFATVAGPVGFDRDGFWADAPLAASEPPAEPPR